jgi:hypothetical protein
MHGNPFGRGNVNTRRRARLRTNAKHKLWGNTLALLVELCNAVTSSSTAFGLYARDVCFGGVDLRGGLRGSLLPLPRALAENVAGVIDCPTSLQSSLVLLVNMSVSGLNFLDANCHATPCSTSSTAAQKSVLARLADKWWWIIRHIGPFTGAGLALGSFQRLVSKGLPTAENTLTATKSICWKHADNLMSVISCPLLSLTRSPTPA